jgi:hypothetical protein
MRGERVSLLDVAMGEAGFENSIDSIVTSQLSNKVDDSDVILMPHIPSVPSVASVPSIASADELSEYSF